MKSSPPLASSPQTQAIVDLCLLLENEPQRKAELQNKAQDRLEVM